MSKAYDRVIIYMLMKALHRLKIPESFITFITNLFLNRKNSVFTTYGNTDFYDVLVGIDQGEVISPLLWIIYYDPLLSRMQNSDLGYTLEVSWSPNINNMKTKSITTSIPNSAYMDDTIWITNSRTKLKNIFDIAQSFFDLNSMQINLEKSFIVISEATTNDISFHSTYLNNPVTY